MPEITLPPGTGLAARGTLTDAVIGVVREMVRSGRLEPGELYSVYQLAEALGVSRSPVREGLLKLAEAGLVTFERNRGFRVVVPSGREIAEIFGVRLALEPAAARRVAARRGPGARQALDAVLAAMRSAAEAGDEDRFWTEDRGLHEYILSTAGNRCAASVVGGLRETTRLIGAGTTTPARTLGEIAEEHAPLVAAIRDGDPALAGSLMSDHLRTTGLLLMATTMDVPVGDPRVRLLWAEVNGDALSDGTGERGDEREAAGGNRTNGTG